MIMIIVHRRGKVLLGRSLRCMLILKYKRICIYVSGYEWLLHWGAVWWGHAVQPSGVQSYLGRCTRRTSVQLCKCTCVQICNSTSFHYSSVHEYSYASVQVYIYASIQVYSYASIHVYIYASIQVYNYASVQIYIIGLLFLITLFEFALFL